jgi:hypothetical protein
LPDPYEVGGAEDLLRWLQDYINEQTDHQAQIIKLPSREHSFWRRVDADSASPSST